ncbi:hypothetical protein Tco_0045016 [Tanacetum coccineum]
MKITLLRGAKSSGKEDSGVSAWDMGAAGGMVWAGGGAMFGSLWRAVRMVEGEIITKLRYSMATNEETNAAGTDTRPPMLVENDYESWKIRIHRYIRGETQWQADRKFPSR